MNLRTDFRFFHQNIEQDIVENVNPVHGQTIAWKTFALKNAGICFLFIAPRYFPAKGSMKHSISLSGIDSLYICTCLLVQKSLEVR